MHSNKHRGFSILLIAACLLSAGCATNIERFQMPDTDLTQVRKVYVATPDDERTATELHSLVKANLEDRGYEVAERTESTTFAQGEYIFDYSADWHWDITWYLLDLRVAIYNPVDATLIAQAQSYQTSVVRRSNEIVVDRAIASLFDTAPLLDGEEE